MANSKIANLSSTVSALQSSVSSVESKENADQAEISSVISKDSQANETITGLKAKVGFLESSFSAISSLPMTVENSTSRFSIGPASPAIVGDFILFGSGYVLVNITNLSEMNSIYLVFFCNCSYDPATNSSAYSAVGPYIIGGTGGTVIVPVLASGEVTVVAEDVSVVPVAGYVFIAYYED